MKLQKPSAGFYIPDGIDVNKAVKRTTHMSIGAHQDDIEIMAYDGILKCFQQDDKWFMGVVVTNGSGSARDGVYKNYTDEEMIVVRKKEQKKAAYAGEYGALALLDHPSKEAKDPSDNDIIKELKELLLLAQPEVLYIHNLADKHDTHIGVSTKVIKAIRELPKDKRPNKLYGCEVWRDLDWLLDEEKVSFDVSHHPNLAANLVQIFDSQIVGGKRYDLATMGRRLANATYRASHEVDTSDAIINAMDLTILIQDDEMDLKTFTTAAIDRLKADVESRFDRVYNK